MTGEPLFDQEWIYKTSLDDAYAGGKAEQALSDAEGLLREGVSTEEISRAISMPLEKVNALKKQMGLK